MPLRANNAGPDIRRSTSSVSRRKASFGEHIPARLPSIADNGADVLADSLYMTQGITLGNHVDTPIDNVRQIVEGNYPDPPSLFCEMLYLSTGSSDDGNGPAPLVWEQLCRWIKYEQKVEGGGTRFSKPHITLLNIQSLIQLKNCIRKGTVILDEHVSTFVQLVERVIQKWTDNGFVQQDQSNYVKDVLYASKLHLINGKLRRINDLQNDDQFNRRGSHLTATDIDIHFDLKVNGNGDALSLASDYSEKFESADTRLLKKLPSDTNSAVILVATVDELEKPLTAFVRLAKPVLLYPEIPDHPVPVKFVFIVLNPRDNYQNETIGIGRTMGALFADEIFKKVAFNATQKFTIGDAIEEFLTQVVAIPPGKCSTETRWEPHEESEHTPRNIGMLYANYDDPFDDTMDEKTHEINIVRSGLFCGGLVDDVKRKSKWFVSDLMDFFKGRMSQSLAVVVFMFFANITSILTFGAVMERALNHQIAAIENIVCGGISGIIFGLFSGQPLNILSATGPTLVFEKILYDFCTGYHWEFLPFRFWVGIWVAIYLMVLVMFDFSALVGLITRFTEEAFATLISVVFIIQAFEKIYEIGYEAPITIHPEEVLHSTCHCLLEDAGPNGTSIVRNLSVGVTRCQEMGGKPEGLQCFFKPDVYMFSIVLMFGTFVIALTLSRFRTSRYFSSKIRNSVSDFGVLIAIAIMTALTHVIGLEVPSLKVPSTLRPTLDRPWIIDITNIESISVCFIAAVPALFYTILITMDQQVTAVIVNRKDNLLRKGYGYHLDLFVITVLVIICSLLGLPFYVAATVLSVMHIDALKLQSECAAPGEKPTFLGVKEQRLTAVLAHVIILCSVFLTSLIKLVPMPVLTGIFLYMGVVSLLGQQFIQRIMLVFMPIKHQPDYTWLRNVRMKRVHLFTLIQTLSILGLFAVKYTKTISMVFPLMLVFMVIIRMFVLERMFNHCELLALDDDVPTFSEVMKPLKIPKKSTGVKTLKRSVTETTALKKNDDNCAFA